MARQVNQGRIVGEDAAPYSGGKPLKSGSAMLKFAPLGLLLLSGTAIAAPVSRPAVIIHQFDALALSPDGARTATVESDDPGNLADEPHGMVTVRDANGKIVAHYDPCTVCRYSGLTWSPKGDALVFLAADKKASKTTLYRAASGDAHGLSSLLSEVESGAGQLPRPRWFTESFKALNQETATIMAR